MYDDITETDKKILECLVGGCGGVIAGGYLRDQVLGIPYKDIDVFLPVPRSVPFSEYILTIGHILHKHLGQYLVVDPQGEDYGSSSFMSYEITIDSHQSKVDLVLVHTASYGNSEAFIHELFDSFHANLSKIAYSVATKLIVDPTFLDDVENKTITYYVSGVDYGKECKLNYKIGSLHGKIYKHLKENWMSNMKLIPRKVHLAGVLSR